MTTKPIYLGFSNKVLPNGNIIQYGILSPLTAIVDSFINIDGAILMQAKRNIRWEVIMSLKLVFNRVNEQLEEENR